MTPSPAPAELRNCRNPLLVWIVTPQDYFQHRFRPTIIHCVNRFRWRAPGQHHRHAERGQARHEAD